ncbi:MAG: M12 family metallopeptidase [Salinimicrobium sp.]
MKKLKLTLVLPALAVLASCSNDPVEETVDQNLPEPAIEVSVDDAMVETANPNEPQGIQDIYFAGQKIPVENFNGEYVYQGDIMIPKNMASTQEVKVVYEKGEIPTNKSTGRTSGRWPNNTVYYAIDSNLDNQTRVYDAIAHWEANTNIEFVERSSQSNYVYFTSGSGCSSYIGMTGGKQDITLASACSTGNAIHEIGHALGLWHEQSRVDRGNYITINYNNIQSGREHNFKTYEEQGFDGEEYTSALDFGSIMMYGSYSFSSNGQPTIVKKDGSTFNIQRNGLSSGDKTGINNMYPYSGGATTVTAPVYENGQYYVVEGVKVYRSGGKWYYYTRNYGWKQVKLSSYGYWYYV